MIALSIIGLWRFKGEPSFEVVTDDPFPYYDTTIDARLRISDVINAPAGFLTIKDLPKPRYKHGNLANWC